MAPRPGPGNGFDGSGEGPEDDIGHGQDAPGAFGLDDLVRFAHVFETLLDELRAGRKPCDAVTVKTLLRASDVLADARVVRLGRTMSFGRVTLSSATDNKPVAMVSSAFAMLPG